jgi:HK97 family phage prohead protease
MTVGGGGSKVGGVSTTDANRLSFIAQGKALDATVDDHGDLIIEGWAAVFDGTDRQGENFTDGAFREGIKSFLSGQAALCYQHKHDLVLGRVLDLREVEGKGLWMRARLDAAVRRHPTLGVIFDQVKKGSIRALSVGGFFKRKLTEAGYKINGVDFTEISVTAVPVHPGTNFAVVAPTLSAAGAKALQTMHTADDLAAVRALRVNLSRMQNDLAIRSVERLVRAVAFHDSVRAARRDLGL